MPVQTVAATAAAASTRSEVGRKPDAQKFAGALAHASSKSSANTPDSVLDAKKAPKGEKTAPVEGHAYADITSGPRNGMFLNTSGNKRDGQAFVLVKRDGKEYHIYGSGKDRLVVCLKRKDDAGDAKNTAGHRKNAVGDGKNTVGDAKNTVGDARNTVGDARNTVGDARNTAPSGTTGSA